MLAHRLEHLDGDDIVELAPALAIVLQPNLRIGILQPVGGEGVLGGRDGEAGHLVGIRRRAFGKAAPAAADLQHRRARFPELGQDALILVLLGAVEFVGPGIERRGIGHAGIEPQRIEIVADVVMVLDVARRALDRIAPHQGIVDHEADAVEQIAVREILEMVQVEQEQADQPFDIVGFPAADDVLLAQPDIAARHDAAKHVPVPDLEARLRARTSALADRHLAIGGDEFQGAHLQPGNGLAPGFLDKGGGNERHGMSLKVR
jgi:hypothetical protein